MLVVGGGGGFTLICGDTKALHLNEPLVKCLYGHCGMREHARMGSTSSLPILSATSFNFSFFLNGLLSSDNLDFVRIKQHFSSDRSLRSVYACGCGCARVGVGLWVCVAVVCSVWVCECGV